MGKRFICGKQGKVQLQCKWSSLSKEFPYQLIVKEIKLQCVYTFSLYKSVLDIFAVSKPCFVIGHPNYGSVGEVIAYIIGIDIIIFIIIHNYCILYTYR